jgi:hypothetical protein
MTSLNDKYTLNNWKAIASIASSIAIPIVLAVIGYIVQTTVASDGLKKDYVKIATNILKDEPSPKNIELRAWAIQILGKYSEIPFSDKASESLKNQQALYSGGIWLPELPSWCMAAPQEIKLNELIQKNTDGRVLDEEDLKKFVLDILGESLKATTNTIALKCLQDSIRIIKGESSNAK